MVICCSFGVPRRYSGSRGCPGYDKYAQKTMRQIPVILLERV
jgi:hypothetical protein